MGLNCHSKLTQTVSYILSSHLFYWFLTCLLVVNINSMEYKCILGVFLVALLNTTYAQKTQEKPAASFLIPMTVLWSTHKAFFSISLSSDHRLHSAAPLLPSCSLLCHKTRRPRQDKTGGCFKSRLRMREEKRADPPTTTCTAPTASITPNGKNAQLMIS